MKTIFKIALIVLVIVVILILLINLSPGFENWLHDVLGWY